MKNLLKSFSIKNAFFIIIGTLIFSLSINVFLAPNNIAPGGISGLATAIRHLNPHLHIGVMTFVFNIPLFVLGWKFVGSRFVLTTGATTLLTSVLLEVTAYLPPYTEDRMLASVFGGAIMGMGLGLVMRCGTTTGGTDILVRVIRKKNPAFSVAALVFTFDLVIVAFAAFVYREITSALYALVAIFIGSIVMDKIVSGADDGKLVHIMTGQTDAIAEAIVSRLGRGVTLLHSKGYYTGSEKDVIMVVIRRYQLAALRRIVKETDPGAFIIFSDATQVFGQGFSNQE